MARQRMMSDGFWKDPNLSNLTTEQRTALVLFLTCEESNVIGIYRVIWRAVGAGMGWTHDQIINAARDLQHKDCVAIHEETGWIWVKEWWKHNSLRGAFTGNVAKKAAQELGQVPEFWKQSVLDWLAENDYEGACKSLISPLQGAGGNPNPSSNPNSNPTTNQQVVEIEDFVDAAVWASPAIKSESGFRRTVRTRILSDGPNDEDKRALSAWRAQRACQDASREASEKVGRDRRAQGDQQRARLEGAEAYFEGLDEPRRASLLASFGTHLDDLNSPIRVAFKRTGIEKRMVQVEFFEFILSTILSELSEEEMA